MRMPITIRTRAPPPRSPTTRRAAQRATGQGCRERSAGQRDRTSVAETAHRPTGQRNLSQQLGTHTVGEPRVRHSGTQCSADSHHHYSHPSILAKAHARRHSVLCSEPTSEELKDLIACLERRLPLFVDEVHRDDIVRGLNHFLEKFRHIRIGGTVGQDA
jgi:hypothetical protein